MYYKYKWKGLLTNNNTTCTGYYKVQNTKMIEALYLRPVQQRCRHLSCLVTVIINGLKLYFTNILYYTIHELENLLFAYFAYIVSQRLTHLFAHYHEICLLLCGYLWEDFRDMNGLHWFVFLWFCNHMNSPVHTHGKSCS